MPGSRGKPPSPSRGGRAAGATKEREVTGAARQSLRDPSSLCEIYVTAFSALKDHLQSVGDQELNDLFSFVARQSSSSQLPSASCFPSGAGTPPAPTAASRGGDQTSCFPRDPSCEIRKPGDGAVDGASRRKPSQGRSAQPTPDHGHAESAASGMADGASLTGELLDDFSTTTTTCGHESSRPARVSTSSSWSSTSPLAAANFFVPADSASSAPFCPSSGGSLSPDCSPINMAVADPLPSLLEQASPSAEKKSSKQPRQMASPASARRSGESPRSWAQRESADSWAVQRRQKKSAADQVADGERSASPTTLRASPRLSPVKVKPETAPTPRRARTPTRSSPRLQRRHPSPPPASDSEVVDDAAVGTRKRVPKQKKAAHSSSKTKCLRKMSHRSSRRSSVAEEGSQAADEDAQMEAGGERPNRGPKAAVKASEEFASVSSDSRRESNDVFCGFSPKKETPLSVSKQRRKGKRAKVTRKQNQASAQAMRTDSADAAGGCDAYFSLAVSPVSASGAKRERDAEDESVPPSFKRKKMQPKEELDDDSVGRQETDGPDSAMSVSRSTSKRDPESLSSEEAAPEPDFRDATAVAQPEDDRDLAALNFGKPVTSLSRTRTSASDGDGAKSRMLTSDMTSNQAADWMTDEAHEDGDMSEVSRLKSKWLHEATDKARRMLSTASTVSGGGASNPALCLMVPDAPHSPEMDTGAFCSPALSSSAGHVGSPTFFRHKVLRPTPDVEEAPEFDLGLFMVRTAALSKHADDVVPCLADEELMEFSVVPRKYISPPAAERPAQSLQERFLHMKLLAHIPKVDGTYQVGLDMKEASWYMPKHPETGMVKSSSKEAAMKKLLEQQDKWNPFSVFGSSLPCVELDDVFDYEVYSTTAPSARVSHPLFRRLAQFYEFKDLWKTVTPAEWDKVRSSFKTHWKKQYKLDLDWRNDPVTVDEFMWMLEANGQTEDKTETVFNAEVCFCVTPNPSENFAWNDPRCHKYQVPRPSMSHLLHERLNDENVAPNAQEATTSALQQACEVKRRSVDAANLRRLSVGPFESGSSRRLSVTGAFSPNCTKSRKDVLPWHHPSKQALFPTH
ncbi:hypothetical protein BESB_009090 [Besnoitia besnoiti]|uniref:Inner centromere protein ARK-binding domain-containing protein n=1 Tax=Besnoitia besnoiti TaxID=94643 RepID=A0A2A9MQL9_BESBE|nr:hypothetical protein BESB_009090 [Besnoitia besnoiti]PFH38567.1 hypothetical protein BESB_009090 [Besnoitia besnoiti]